MENKKEGYISYCPSFVDVLEYVSINKMKKGGVSVIGLRGKIGRGRQGAKGGWLGFVWNY